MINQNNNNQKPRLFINYRSKDTGPTASRLYVELIKHFGIDQVFLDHEQIDGGANWPERLQFEVSNATIMYVLIGDQWLTTRDEETGDRLLNLPDDWVRKEIEIAKSSSLEIIPILVEGASIPSTKALQTVNSIDFLTNLQGLPLRRKDWETDFKRLEKILLDLGFTHQSSENPKEQIEPIIEIVLDRLSPYQRFKAGRPVVYGTVKLSDGSIGYGEGLQIQLTIENHSKIDINVPIIEVIINSYEAHPIESFEYPTIKTSGLHLEVPGSMRADPIKLSDLELVGSSLPVTQGRIFLRGATGPESQHTLNFSLEAMSSGIWTVQIQAKYFDALHSSDPRFVKSETLCIVKR